MPIFHDPQDSPSWRVASRQMSAEDESNEDKPDSDVDITPLGGLSLESVMGSTAMQEQASYATRPTSQDRNGLIERIKRVKSPLWQFYQNVSICCRMLASN